MKPRVAIAALLVTAVWVTLSHFEWQKFDNGHLLVVDGRPLDVQGWLSDRLNRLRRDCARVTRLQPQDERLTSALVVLKAYSPPASHTARVSAAWATDQWLLVEAAFDDLLPAVVLMTRVDTRWAIAPQGIWSGQTHPWMAAPLIRDYLERQMPAAPGHLLACFDPTESTMPSPQRPTN
ncbi:hypothetical protein [Limnohabitans sp. DM1]|uniref:hypothetical protein n=1 Tax=Limnohabitans sp. DM1 TaxID=1597955 RepID=UPI000A8B584F|nr:hypothetical protein [Limnohabitans sp. DM1]